MVKVELIETLLLIFLVGTLAGCLQEASNERVVSSKDEGLISKSPWMDTELTDVRTGKVFRISDFKGRPVLMESFAVWCPTCTEQQKQTKELKEQVGDQIVHVSLDTDPNEDEERIREHVTANGFEWYYAVSPIENTRALIDEFGQKIVFAPGVPMVLICPDQSTRLLRTGVKSPDDMLSEVEKGC